MAEWDAEMYEIEKRESLYELQNKKERTKINEYFTEK